MIPWEWCATGIAAAFWFGGCLGLLIGVLVRSAKGADEKACRE